MNETVLPLERIEAELSKWAGKHIFVGFSLSSNPNNRNPSFSIGGKLNTGLDGNCDPYFFVQGTSGAVTFMGENIHDILYTTYPVYFADGTSVQTPTVVVRMKQIPTTNYY